MCFKGWKGRNIYFQHTRSLTVWMQGVRIMGRAWLASKMLFVRKSARQIQGAKLIHLCEYIPVFWFSEIAFCASILHLVLYNLGNYGLWYVFWFFFFIFFFKNQPPTEPVATTFWVWRDSSVTGFLSNCQGFKLRKCFPNMYLTGKRAGWHLSVLLLPVSRSKHSNAGCFREVKK